MSNINIHKAFDENALSATKPASRERFDAIISQLDEIISAAIKFKFTLWKADGRDYRGKKIKKRSHKKKIKK